MSLFWTVVTYAFSSEFLYDLTVLAETMPEAWPQTAAIVGGFTGVMLYGCYLEYSLRRAERRDRESIG